jgi:hypothetical protein
MDQFLLQWTRTDGSSFELHADGLTRSEASAIRDGIRSLDPDARMTRRWMDKEEI